MYRKLRDNNVERLSLSCHPGVSFSNLYTNLPKILNNSILSNILNHTFFQTPYKSAMPAIMTALSPEIKGGDFLVSIQNPVSWESQNSSTQPIGV